MVVKDLDIYDQVGYGMAHDEYIPFKIQNGQLKVGSKTTPFTGHLYVEFLKVTFFIIKLDLLLTIDIGFYLHSKYL